MARVRAAAGRRPGSAWRTEMKKFDVRAYQISFWNYVASHLQGPEMVDLMREMGCTMHMSPEHKIAEGLPSMHKVLSRCEEFGMPCIIYDHRVTLRVLLDRGEEEYVANLRAVYADYKDYPAAAYCFIWDEPNSDEEYRGVIRACKLMRAEMPSVRPFVSLNHVGMRSEKDADRVLELTAREIRPDFLLYNCYSQCMEEESDRQQGLENYFHNLQKFMETGKKYDLPVWQSLLLTGHLCLANPTQEQLRWQLNVGAAHGVTGFFWFHPLELGYSCDARGHAIDCRGNKTAKYAAAAYESFRFMEDIAPRLENYRHEKTYHFHMNAGEFECFYKDRDDLIAEVYTEYNRPLVIGKFVGKDDSSRHAVMVVNASQDKICRARISFGGKNAFTDESYLSPGSAKIYEL